MTLDPMTVIAATAMVVNVSGLVYVVETIVRRDDGAAPWWTVGYLCAMLSSLARLAVAHDGSNGWAAAVAGAMAVGFAGFMWLGCLVFNRRPVAWPMVAVVGAVVAVGGCGIAASPGPQPWSAALTEMVLAAAAALAAIECARGRLRATRTALTLTAVVGVWAVHRAGRAVVVAGPGGRVPDALFGTVAAAFVTIALMVVLLPVLTALRRPAGPVWDIAAIAHRTGADAGVLIAPQFGVALQGLLMRARWRHELVAVLAVRIDDLDRIGLAFGRDTVEAIVQAWRVGVRRHAPAVARVGEDGRDILLVSTVVETVADARRVAARIAQGLLEDLQAARLSVLPVVGIGLALNDTVGDDPAVLVAAARGSAVRGESVADAAHGLDPTGM